MIRLETQHYPLIIARWIGTVSAAEYTSHLQELQAIFMRAEQERTYVAMVVDSAKQQDVEPAARKLMSEGRDDSPRFIGSWATMTPVVKLVVTAMKWMKAENLKLVVPCHKLSEAFAGAAAALKEKGVRLSPETEAMIARENAA